jgi:hypothetical protein
VLAGRETWHQCHVVWMTHLDLAAIREAQAVQAVRESLSVRLALLVGKNDRLDCSGRHCPGDEFRVQTVGTRWGRHDTGDLQLALRRQGRAVRVDRYVGAGRSLDEESGSCEHEKRKKDRCEGLACAHMTIRIRPPDADHQQLPRSLLRNVRDLRDHPVQSR